MAYSTYDDIYWSDVDLDSDYTTNEKFLSRYEPSQQHPLSDFSNTNEQLTVINGYLYRVDKESGEIHHYGDDWQEYVVGGDIVNHIFLQYSIADTAKSKQAHREYSNELGDKSTNAAHNGIKEYAHILNKRDFEKLFILCNEVDRRNLVFIKRKKLCDILNTSYDHLKRVLNLLEEKQYIKVDKQSMKKILSKSGLILPLYGKVIILIVGYLLTCKDLIFYLVLSNERSRYQYLLLPKRH